ncbi:MAG TPA: DMT family transporter [Casimicrobiaceae bacterium]|nr:DMT family transporter [Casimicrobiaceae bacterium]
MFGVRSRAGAYVALCILTLAWGGNWIAMKLALAAADPVVFNVERTWLAAAVLAAVLWWRGGPLWPSSWKAVLITGLFQTTLNFGSTTMALAGGGAGRTSVLVFTMPFWTLLIAWPVLHQRVRGSQWLAVAFALTGLTLIVAPWDWRGDITPKLWAISSGFGWAAGTVCTKYFSRDPKFDLLSFVTWQTLIGNVPLTVLMLAHSFPPTSWSVAQVLLMVYVGALSTGLGFLLWMQIVRWLPAGTASLNMFAIPVIALASSMALFGERLSANETLGMACLAVGLAVITVRALRARQPAPASVAVGGEGG